MKFRALYISILMAEPSLISGVGSFEVQYSPNVGESLSFPLRIITADVFDSHQKPSGFDIFVMVK